VPVTEVTFEEVVKKVKAPDSAGRAMAAQTKFLLLLLIARVLDPQ